MRCSLRAFLAASTAACWIGWSGMAAAQPPLEALPSILQLQLGQHPAWRAYKDAAAQSRRIKSTRASRVSEMNAMTTPERLAAVRVNLQTERQGFERGSGCDDRLLQRLVA